MVDIIAGKIWKFGDNIDTDVIAPGKYLMLGIDELAKHALEPVSPTFAGSVQEGDIIIGGRNFGCGSSREQAPDVLKSCGIAAICAVSFGRIFYRNSFAIGLPAVICEGVSEAFNEDDEAEINLEEGTVTNKTTGKTLQAKELPPVLIETLAQGGALKYLKNKIKEERKKAKAQ
jgi:3-isopropylmalate dehydratase small subunit